MKLFKQILFALVISLMFTACIDDDNNEPSSGRPKRTLIVYLAGDDSSISSVLKGEVEALRQGWTYTGNRCLIYLDPADDVPQLLSLRGGCSTTPTPWIETVKTYPEQNSASAEVFANVLSDIITLYPSDGYGMILTSHASGWLPEGTLQRPTRSIGSDKNPGESTATNTQMELADFAAAIPDHQFEFIVFEACLMSNVEVAYALRNKTDYILASSAELVIPGYVPLFPDKLRILMNTKKSALSSLQLFGEAYYTYIMTLSGDYKSTTQSIVKTALFDDLAAAVKEVYATSTVTLDINTIQHFDRPGSYGDSPASPRFFDFLDYMEQIASPDQYARIENIIKQTVLWKQATPSFFPYQNGFDIKRHSGLTSYIEQDVFPKLNQSYEETAWWQATRGDQ